MVYQQRCTNQKLINHTLKKHASVLSSEVIEFLNVRGDGVYLDATGGDGGHASLILSKLGPHGRIFICDCDSQAIDLLKHKFLSDKRVSVYHARFSELEDFFLREEWQHVDGLVADLGISSRQLEDENKGIGFRVHGPLDMRMDSRLSCDASDLLKNLKESELADLIFQLGEERHSRKIARAIVDARSQKKLTTTTDLRELAEKKLGPLYRHQKIHPATRLFMALRIAVNQELEELDSLMSGLKTMLAPKGRAVVISFHSLEDRKVKRAYLAYKDEGWKILTKKPVLPSEEEMQNNPRSRSAKLRAIENRGSQIVDCES